MMSTAADHLYTLHRNAFALAPVIQSFYLDRAPMEKDVLLSYLVLPLVSFPAMQEYLHTANRTSSIRTMTSESSRLVGLSLRISEYEPITNKALLILRSDEAFNSTTTYRFASVKTDIQRMQIPRCCVMRVSLPWYLGMKVS